MLLRFWPQIKLPQRRWLTLPAANFQHILDDVGDTCKPYLGDPLAEMSPSRRGMLLQQLGQKLLERSQPACKLESAGRDCTIDSKTVQFRSAQLAFNQRGNSWGVKFRSVKFAHPGYRDAARFEELYLVIYSPTGFHFVMHDWQTGVGSEGIRTACSGHMIRVSGRSGDGWSAALRHVLARLTLEGSCELLAHIKPSDPLVQGLQLSSQMNSAGNLAQQSSIYKIYKGVPLGKMNPMLRGLRVQQIAQLIDQTIHPDCAFERAIGNRPSDWIRDGIRVEVKHSAMLFQQRRFLCVFSGVKADLFDELWLVIYSPLGLHMFKHNGAFGLSSSGARTEAVGNRITITGPLNQLCSEQALAAMKQKLQAAECERIAEVLW